MKDTLTRILKEYNTAQNESFKENILEKFLRKQAPEIIIDRIKLDIDKYKVTGSAGKGRWAEIPWIAVFDRDITTTATSGYDIVYLFCADMSGVYLSLNQGWTYYKDKYGMAKGKENIKVVSNAWRQIIKSKLSDFSCTKINLKSENKNADLAKGYELGHICGKFYDINNMPTEKTLEQDLINLLGVYRELKGNLVKGNIEKTNNKILSDEKLGIFSIDDENADEHIIDQIICNKEQNINIVLTECPNMIRETSKKEALPVKVNFIEKAKNQKKIGLAGEKAVVEYEKNLLTNSGFKNLALKVEHISETKGDGLGYDILSFDINGNPKYIEVKTTVKGCDEPFIVTGNEVAESKKYQDSYCIYRIYNFDAKKGMGNLYIVRGSLEKKLTLQPKDYIVAGIL